MTDSPVRAAESAPAESGPALAVSPAKLAHLVLLTPDLPRMRDWYETVLQATVTVENPMLCFLSYDEEHHRIALVGMPDLPPPAPGPRAGLHHMAFTYRSLDDLLRTYQRLKRLGIEPYWPIHHGVTISIYYRDPDGNGVELQVDAFDSMAEAKAYMRSDGFRNNPIGVMYDPEELMRRHRAGEPFESLRQQPPLPPGKTPADMLRI
jgi:catechol 2,3-dioxygenase-like lactoylglutathione lyase family enzyme